MAKVLLGSLLGPPSQLGSGILAGIPLNKPNDGEIVTTIPDQFFKDIGFNFERAGGAGWPQPYRGYAFGHREYKYRFLSALSHYRTAKKLGARFILVADDLWGIDKEPYIHPGDNGDWTTWDDFLTALISDIKTSDMSEGLIIDIWNEPDNLSFWKRDQQQYLDMWTRSYVRLRQELPSVRLAGPATEYGPGEDNSVFTGWAKHVATTNTIPDIYTWHSLYATRSPMSDFGYFNRERAKFGLPQRPININEYLAYEEEGPGAVAWYLSQLERLDVRGCRANWAKGGESPESFHHLLANLLGPMNLTEPFYTNGEYQLYKYYASMSGQRVTTLPSLGMKADLFATVDHDGSKVKILTGPRCNIEPYSITVSGFSSLGSSGQVSLRQLAFEWRGLFGEVQGPTELGLEILTIENDAVKIDVNPRAPEEAYAIELFCSR